MLKYTYKGNKFISSNIYNIMVNHRKKPKTQNGKNPLLIPLAVSALTPIVSRGVNWIVDKLTKKGQGRKSNKMPRLGGKGKK